MKFKWKHVFGVGPRGLCEDGVIMRRDGGSGDAEVPEGGLLMQQSLDQLLLWAGLSVHS